MTNPYPFHVHLNIGMLAGSLHRVNKNHWVFGMQWVAAVSVVYWSKLAWQSTVSRGRWPAGRWLPAHRAFPETLHVTHIDQDAVHSLFNVSYLLHIHHKVGMLPANPLGRYMLQIMICLDVSLQSHVNASCWVFAVEQARTAWSMYSKRFQHELPHASAWLSSLK